MEELFTTLTRAVEGTPAIALGAAFVWGVLSVLLSPCHLGSIPLIVGFINGQGVSTTRRAFVVSVAFAGGILATIYAIGYITHKIGGLMGDLGAWANYLVAGLFFLVGLVLLDVIPLLALQTSLVLGIARVFRYRITLGRVRELLATFGLGFLGRTLFQELSKLGGPPGWALAAAIAASTTAAMGYAATVWFERGERLTRERVRDLARGLSGQLLERLRGLGRRRPGRQKVEEAVEAALEALPSAAPAPPLPPGPTDRTR